MFYTGIGARNTPASILHIMRDLAFELANKGYTLRSGGADGADSAFEQGCDLAEGKKEIYLPWKGFNNNKSDLYNIPDNAFKIAEHIYQPSRWKHLPKSVRSLMARNIQQVSGKNLDITTDFIACWTPDGCESASTRKKKTGGTGQAIAYADRIYIPIFNLANDGAIIKIKKYIELMGVIKW